MTVYNIRFMYLKQKSIALFKCFFFFLNRNSDHSLNDRKDEMMKLSQRWQIIINKAHMWLNIYAHV